VGHQHPPLHPARQLTQHVLRRRRVVDHGLGDAGEALDAAAQRPLGAHQGVPLVVGLPAADEHGAHLGELAQLAATPVGLGVHGQELGGGERRQRQIHPGIEPLRSDRMKRPSRALPS
jgi:hypothetical protein